MVRLLVLLYLHQVLHLVGPGATGLTPWLLHIHFGLLRDWHFLQIVDLIVVPASLALLILAKGSLLILGKS